MPIYFLHLHASWKSFTVGVILFEIFIHLILPLILMKWFKKQTIHGHFHARELVMGIKQLFSSKLKKSLKKH